MYNEQRETSPAHYQRIQINSRPSSISNDKVGFSYINVFIYKTYIYAHLFILFFLITKLQEEKQMLRSELSVGVVKGFGSQLA